MRDTILDYLNSLKLKNFKVSSEMPFQPNGTALHLKNPKTIYTDAEQITTEPFIQLFDSTIDKEDKSVTIYLATDAKQLPKDYTDVVAQLREAKEVFANEYLTRTSETNTEYDTDLLITTVTITLSKIIT